jgi:hypothetical protein
MLIKGIFIMTLYEKLEKTFDDKNVEAYLDLLHEDFVVVFHKSGNSFSKSEWGEMIAGMFANDKFIRDSSRCVYENDDIMVQHMFMSYPDDSKEAVMGIAMLKDGKVIRMETGATSLN